jgi:hypothetical protein
METALLRVHRDLVRAVDQKHVVALVLMDLSSVFDTVDHAILFTVPERRFGIRESALTWFTSTYLTEPKCSMSAELQGSVLRHIAFIAYTADVTYFSISITPSVMSALMTNKPMFTFQRASSSLHARNALQDCIADVGQWCASRRLQLNASKTELIWFGSRQLLA